MRANCPALPIGALLSIKNDGTRFTPRFLLTLPIKYAMASIKWVLLYNIWQQWSLFTINEPNGSNHTYIKRSYRKFLCYWGGLLHHLDYKWEFTRSSLILLLYLHVSSIISVTDAGWTCGRSIAVHVYSPESDLSALEMVRRPSRSTAWCGKPW